MILTRELLPIKHCSILIFRSSGKWLQIISILNTKIKKWKNTVCLLFRVDWSEVCLQCWYVAFAIQWNISQRNSLHRVQTSLKAQLTFFLFFSSFSPKLFRAADTQALATHKKVRLLENTVGQVPLHLWQISKGSQREVIFTWKHWQSSSRK